MRYAVYATPAPGSPLALAAAAWLGRDPVSGAALERPPVPGLAPARVDALTADPRRYGFHATLRSPFTPRPEVSEAALVEALEAFASARPALRVPMVVARLGGFLAIVPDGPAPALDRLAADAVIGFEPFRAPPGEAEMARRRAGGLTPRQEEHLRRWGYPHVFDDFRFHMTLTGRVEGAEADALLAAARDRFAVFLADPLPVDTVGLFVEPEPGAPFRIVATAPLTPEESPA